MKTLLLIQFTIIAVIFGSWGVNLYKLTQADWEAPYKEEVIRSIAIPVPPVAIITAWIDFE